jgi:small subunit ribosomal protein SAe
MNFPTILNPDPEDIKMLLSCKSHLGDQNCNPKMERYVYKKRNGDGVNVINLAKTYEKLILAARVIVAIENPADVCVISTPQIGQRAVLKYARFTGANAISGRFTPGTFTNQIQKNFIEPRLLIVTDPRQDSQAVIEASYVNIPTIAFCNTNCPVKFVDVVIPCNTNTTESVGLMYWLLAREVSRLRGTLERSKPWDVMVDLFFWRSPDDKLEERKASEEAALHDGGGAQLEFQAQESSNWVNEQTSSGAWDHSVPSTPSAEWTTEAPQAGDNWGITPSFQTQVQM